MEKTEEQAQVGAEAGAGREEAGEEQSPRKRRGKVWKERL